MHLPLTPRDLHPPFSVSPHAARLLLPGHRTEPECSLPREVLITVHSGQLAGVNVVQLLGYSEGPASFVSVLPHAIWPRLPAHVTEPMVVLRV